MQLDQNQSGPASSRVARIDCSRGFQATEPPQLIPSRRDDRKNLSNVATRRGSRGEGTGLERPAYIRFGATRLQEPPDRPMLNPPSCNSQLQYLLRFSMPPIRALFQLNRYGSG